MNNQSKLFRKVNEIILFDDNMIESAKECFQDYVEKGIILTTNFEENKWATTNEYSNVSFIFNLNKFQYKRFYEQVFQLSFDDFVTYLKSFIVLSMEHHVLITLQAFLRDIKKLVKELKVNEVFSLANMNISNPSVCIDFLSTLPCLESNELTQLIEQLDELLNVSYQLNTREQRKLAQFQSYFLFNDILNDYWVKPLSDEERLFYYPLYLWWQITAVVPLRPREFLLTQRNCLTEKNGNYYLTLRRNNLKGKDKGVSHKISEDYYLTTYEVPFKLASEILNYLELTKDLSSTQLDTLFVTDSHYRKWKRIAGTKNRFLTYSNLNTILKYFFNEIVSQQYGYFVHHINSPNQLEDHEINFIHIGDTRHIAMINLIAEGASPVTAMLLAGHDSVTTSSHYFSNLSQFIECRSYQLYRKLTNSQTSYAISKTQHKYTINKNYVPLDNKGRCYSPRFAEGDYSDCLKVISSHAELGACTSCPFYRKAGKDYFSMDKSFKKSIDEEALIVDEAIKRVRQGKGNIEDIGEALLKLKTVSHSYQEYLTEKHLSLQEFSNGEKEVY